MINIKKIVLYLVFGLFVLNNSLSFAGGAKGANGVDDRFIDNIIANIMPKDGQGFRVTPEHIGKFAKYGSIAISAFYAINGIKKSVESVKLLIPVDRDLKFMDLLKFPFRLMAFPFKVVDVGRCFFISGSLGAFSYLLHKAGA